MRTIFARIRDLARVCLDIETYKRSMYHFRPDGADFINPGQISLSSDRCLADVEKTGRPTHAPKLAR